MSNFRWAVTHAEFGLIQERARNGRLVVAEYRLPRHARVRTFAEWRVFRRRYFQRNPIGYIEWHLRQRREALIESIRQWSEYLGIKRPLKWIYRTLVPSEVKVG